MKFLSLLFCFLGALTLAILLQNISLVSWWVAALVLWLILIFCAAANGIKDELNRASPGTLRAYT
jgi:hypothetical protein